MFNTLQSAVAEEAICKLSAHHMGKFLKRRNEDENDAAPFSKAKVFHNPDFIKSGFVNGGSEAEPRAQCVECGLTLANEALNPSKRRRNLETKHPELGEVQSFITSKNWLRNLLIFFLRIPERDTYGLWTHFQWFSRKMMLLCPHIWIHSFWKFPRTAL